jgi:hypothetical protein
LERNGFDELSEDDSDYEEGSDKEFLTDEEEEEMSDDISESDSMEDEDEELENEEEVDDENDESVSEPEVPSIEQPTIEKVIESEITFTEIIQSSPPPPPQTQTPPITPGQPSTSRKRPLPTDDEEPTTDDIPLHQEPSPVTRLEKGDVLHDAKSPEQRIDECELVIDEKKQELKLLETIYRPNGNKRRRIDDEETGKKGWTNVAATVGKYTIAGVVGGIATLVGLAWAENQGF